MVHAFCERCMLLKRYPLFFFPHVCQMNFIFVCKVLYHQSSFDIVSLHGTFCVTARNDLTALVHVCCYSACSAIWPQVSWSVFSNSYIVTQQAVTLLWPNIFNFRNLENMANARTLLASAYRMDTLFSGRSVLKFSKSSDMQIRKKCLQLLIMVMICII